MDKQQRDSIALFAAICISLFYLAIFPYLISMAAMSFKIFDSGKISLAYGVFLISLIFCIPLSVLTSLYLIWSSYLRKQIGRLYFAIALPFVVAGIVASIITLLEHK